MARKPEPASSFVDMFSKLGQDLKMPSLDVQAMLDHHRKNLEALERSARATAAGASSVIEAQRAQLQHTLQEIGEMAENLRSGGGSPTEIVSKQMDFARRSFETAVKNASDIGEILRKSGTETVEILRQRIREAVEEIRDGYESRK